MGSRPGVWERLLSRLLPEEARDEIIGDLAEGYRAELQRAGPRRARAWYLVEILGVLRVALWYGIAGPLADHGLRNDLRYAFRQLRRRPGFSGVVIMALAIGVGAFGMIFGLVDSVFLQPLPYPHAERLGVVTYAFSGSSTDGFGIALQDVRELRRRTATLESIAEVLDWRYVDLTGEEEPLRLPASFIGPAYAELLGLRTVAGRLFNSEENRDGTGALVAILSEGLWRSRFGGRDDIVGAKVVVNGVPVEVVGVLDDDGRDLRQRFDNPAQIYLPLFTAEPLLGLDLAEDRAEGDLAVVTRARSGYGLDAVRQDLAEVSAELAREFPASNNGWALHVDPLDEVFFFDARAIVGTLAAGAVLLFVLVAVNLTGLFVVQATTRQHEGAVRLALGAGRGRLVRQSLVESAVLCSLGSLLGVALAVGGLDLVAATGLLDLPGFARPRVHLGVIGKTLTPTFLLALSLGLTAGATLLRGGTVGSSAGSRSHTANRRAKRVRTLLVAAEIGLAFVLLIGAGLLLRSFQTLRDTDYGFDTRRLVTLRMEPRGAAYDEAHEQRQFAQDLVRAARQLPGVQSAFLWSPNNMGEGAWVDLLTPEGRWDLFPSERLESSRHHLLPGGLGEAGIALVAGRDFGGADDERGREVALVSQSLARHFWPGDQAIGRLIESRINGELVTREVVGVVEDVRHRSRLVGPFEPQFDVYYPYLQMPQSRLTLAVRWNPGVDLASLTTAVRRLIRDLDPELPIYDLATVSERMRLEEGRSRITALLGTVYSLLAACLAGLGLYGVLSQSVQQQRVEIGIRRALGATTTEVMGRFFRWGLGTAAAGTLAGVVLLLAGGRLLRGVLYGVQPWDPGAVSGALALTVVVTVLAVLAPAYRASRVDPRATLAGD